MSDVQSLAWPASRGAAAVAALAVASKLPSARRDASHFVDLEAAALDLGLEAEPISTTFADLERVLDRAAPFIVKMPGAMLLAVIRVRRNRVTIVTPGRAIRTIPRNAVTEALLAEIEPKHAQEIDAVLDAAMLSPRGRRRARAALLRERLAWRRVEIGWLLRPAMGAPIAAQLRAARAMRPIVRLTIAYLVEYGLGIVGWWFVGQGALEGRFDTGFIAGWALVLFSQIPFRLLSGWYQGLVAIDIGVLLKQRLMAGTVELPLDAIRTRGVGQLLGHILESEAIESLALNSGVVGLLSLVELLVAAVVLAIGAGGILHVALLLLTIAVTVFLGLRYHRERARWTESRSALTHDLVERMAGHRTRLTQQHPDDWHQGEDGTLDAYASQARAMDAHAVRLLAFVPRGFILLGIAGLGSSFASGTASRPALAIAMGGVLLAYRALRKLVIGVGNLSGAVIAWRAVGPVLGAASQRERPKAQDPLANVPVAAASDADPDRPIVEASELAFRYATRGKELLRGCSLRIHPGDRILIEGGSGSGKSTFGAILAGLREPDAGLLLVHGFDRKTLGLHGFRRRVVAAPQFHENHVFSSSFAFNLLMGRAWPPSAEDLALAEKLCHELDLGPLLERMPAGIHQMVGETGWQLSHGEKGRLFAARALLQGGDVLVLDETFAALDPRTLRHSLDCALRHSNALVVIAHP